MYCIIHSHILYSHVWERPDDEHTNWPKLVRMWLKLSIKVIFFMHFHFCTRVDLIWYVIHTLLNKIQKIKQVLCGWHTYCVYTGSYTYSLQDNINTDLMTVRTSTRLETFQQWLIGGRRKVRVSDRHAILHPTGSLISKPLLIWLTARLKDMHFSSDRTRLLPHIPTHAATFEHNPSSFSGEQQT